MLEARLINGQFLKKIFVTSQRYQRGPFGKPKRNFEEKNRQFLDQYNSRRLKLSERGSKPTQFKLRSQPPNPKILTKEHKLPSLAESMPRYQKYSQDEVDQIEHFDTYYDPLFNPHLHEGRYRVNPEEEPFNAIYADSNSTGAQEYTKVRNITTPELWEYVDRLARIKIAPELPRRKKGEEAIPLASGFVPPPENAPDLPYFVPRTRNYLLPVYYHLGEKEDDCNTLVKQVTGDLWKFEEDLRTHLESLSPTSRRILTSVQETDARVLFRGRYLHQVVAWLHKQGF